MSAAALLLPRAQRERRARRPAVCQSAHPTLAYPRFAAPVQGVRATPALRSASSSPRSRLARSSRGAFARLSHRSSQLSSARRGSQPTARQPSTISPSWSNGAGPAATVATYPSPVLPPPPSTSLSSSPPQQWRVPAGRQPTRRPTPGLRARAVSRPCFAAPALPLAPASIGTSVRASTLAQIAC